jgi:TetR/AcrR family transcriptional repressor of nem operon
VKQESETKRKLLEAATALIWENSYGSVSVDDICTQADVNKGSFYYAFKSKSDLAVAAYERHWQMMQQGFDRAFSPQLTPLERIDRYCQLVLEGQKSKLQSVGKVLGCPFCALGSELSTQDENIRLKAEQINARMTKYVESLVRDLVAQGLVEVSDVAELAREVSTYINGVLLQAKIENSLKPIERLRQGILRLLNIKSVQPAAA